MINNISYVILIFFINLNVTMSWNWPWSGTCLSKEPHLIADAFESNMSSTLFGQHLVEEPITSALLAHLEHQPKKALVLSFHGAPGVGKTFIAKKIGYHLFDKQSEYVKFYSGRNDFTDSMHVNIHKERLSNEIRSTVEQCPYALFIFDEANYMADGLFDVLRPFTEFLDSYHGVDYRRSTFIFISNIGQSKIHEIYIEKMKQGRREDLILSDFEEALSFEAFNVKGGLKEVSLIQNFLIDYYIPFLPLEEEHIIKCIQSELKDQGAQASIELTNIIYNALPRRKIKNEKGTESIIISNCKKIPSEVAKVLGKLQRTARNLRKKDEF